MNRRSYAFIIILGVSLLALIYFYWTTIEIINMDKIVEGDTNQYSGSGSGSGSGSTDDQNIANEIDDLQDTNISTGL